MKEAFRIEALLTGKVQPLGSRGAPSGIVKRRVDRPLELGPSGFSGDEQGDTRNHGGPDKAVHHYPLDHYAAWTSEIGDVDILGAPGAFGENLSTSGLTEEDAAIGDVFALGTARVTVSQGRQPCWKLNERFAVPDMARRVQASGRTGWYYRVLEPGRVTPDDRLMLIDRTDPTWTVHRIWGTFYVDTLDRDALAQLAALPGLAEGWRRHAARRLETSTVEDWKRRLDGSD